ncbi:MAG: MFS transporter [Ktedonobacteraceae bacterium]
MIQPASIQSSVRTSRVPRIHLVLTFLAFILIGANDGALGVLIPSMRAFYHIDTVTISWLFLTFSIGYLSASFNTGLLMAKLGERRFLLLGIALFILGAGLFSLQPPFALFLCAGTQLGFSVGIIDAGINAYVASLPNNATLLNYLHAFYGVGALLGPLGAAGLLALHFGWQATYLVWLCLALLIFLGFWLAFKHQLQPASSDHNGNVLFDTLRLRSVWLVALFLFFYAGVEVGLGNWNYSFLTVARSGPALLSAWIVSGYWLGLTLGRLTLANLAPRLGARRLMTLCLSGVMLGLLLAWFIPNLWGAALGLCLVGFCLGPLFPTAIALMSQLAPSRLLPSAIGFLASFGSAGVAFFPWLAGNFVQRLGFWTLLPFAFVVTVGMFGVWVVLNRLPKQE